MNVEIKKYIAISNDRTLVLRGCNIITSTPELVIKDATIYDSVLTILRDLDKIKKHAGNLIYGSDNDVIDYSNAPELLQRRRDMGKAILSQVEQLVVTPITISFTLED